MPKLKLEHISLGSFSKMRVDLAAQVSVFLLVENLNPCHLAVFITLSCR